MTAANLSQPTAVFMMGGPGSGKSFIRDRDFAGLAVVVLLSVAGCAEDYRPLARLIRSGSKMLIRPRPRLTRPWSAYFFWSSV